MKNLRKGFTLVEMLIVVVIIGILAAALLPRLLGAQGATRDVARQKDLGDISAAIEMYSAQRGEYLPTAGAAANYSATTALKSTLVTERGYMKDMPMDPKKNSKLTVIADSTTAMDDNSYGYFLIKKNGVDNGAYVLVAGVETVDKANATSAQVKALTAGTDLKDMKFCASVKKVTGGTTTLGFTEAGECIVKDESELRYIMVR